MLMSSTIEIFCCYAHEDQPILKKLKAHLMPLQRQEHITIWSDSNINAGVEWEQEIKKHLDTAHIILLLISSDFMGSDYCYSKEMKRAMERHERGEACVIPILVSPTYWKGAPFDKLQALPTNARPITDGSWTVDEALVDVAEKISIVVNKLQFQKYMAEADHFNQEQCYKEALVILNQIIKLFPEYASTYSDKGETSIALKSDQESLDPFDKTLQADPSVSHVHFHQSRAQTLSHLQHYEESLAEYDTALSFNPQNPLSCDEKASVLLQLHRFEEALTMYEQAIRLEPENAMYKQHAGDILTGLQRYEEALAKYEQAIQLAPLEVEFHQRKAEILLGLRRYADALSAYETCISIGTNADPYFYFGKGQALFGLEQCEEALAAYDQAIHLTEPDPDPRFYFYKRIIHERLARQSYEREKQARLRWKPYRKTRLTMIAAIRAGSFTLLQTLSGHVGAVWVLASNPDGQILASGSRDKTIKLWDWQTGRELRALSGHTGPVWHLEFSPDGQVLASGSSDKTVKLWDWRTGLELRSLTRHSDDVVDLTFSPDGQVLASSSRDKTVKLWDWQTGRELRTLSGHTDSVQSLAWNPDSQIVASGSRDQSIKLWDWQTGRELRTLSGHMDSVQSLAWNPDGQVLASASRDKTVKLWDWQTGRELRTLSEHMDSIQGVAWDPDGQILASGSRDQIIKLWDWQTGQELRTLSGHAGPIEGIVFSPDGRVLASASDDQTIKLWGLP
jgi:WD40 repeat protein